MPTITLSIPKNLKKTMDELKIINWSEVAREAIREKAEQLSFLRKFSKESELTEKDAVELGKELNKKVSKHYKKK